MKLYEFTSVTGEDGARVVLVAGRVADHSDPTKQTGWITFQIAIDAPTGRSGATLRSEALEKARDILHQLSVDFENVARRAGQEPLGHRQ
jgi:hypothetical protein